MIFASGLETRGRRGFLGFQTQNIGSDTKGNQFELRT